MPGAIPGELSLAESAVDCWLLSMHAERADPWKLQCQPSGADFRALRSDTVQHAKQRHGQTHVVQHALCGCKQGFLDSALVVGSFHVIDRVGEEGLERAVRTHAAAFTAGVAHPVLVSAPAAVQRLSISGSARCVSMPDGSKEGRLLGGSGLTSPPSHASRTGAHLIWRGRPLRLLAGHCKPKAIVWHALGEHLIRALHLPPGRWPAAKLSRASEP